jgi:hypothetical protein
VRDIHSMHRAYVTAEPPHTHIYDPCTTYVCGLAVADPCAKGNKVGAGAPKVPNPIGEVAVRHAVGTVGVYPTDVHACPLTSTVSHTLHDTGGTVKLAVLGLGDGDTTTVGRVVVGEGVAVNVPDAGARDGVPDDGRGLGLGVTLGTAAGDGDTPSAGVAVMATFTASRRSVLVAVPCLRSAATTLGPGSRIPRGTLAVRSWVLFSTLLMVPVAYLQGSTTNRRKAHSTENGWRFSSLVNGLCLQA